MPKKKPLEGKPEVHKDLDGFEIHINEFGQIIPNKPVDEINKFLNKKVDDKKLIHREDYDDIRGKSDEDDQEDEDIDDTDMEIDEDFDLDELDDDDDDDDDF